MTKLLYVLKAGALGLGLALVLSACGGGSVGNLLVPVVPSVVPASATLSIATVGGASTTISTPGNACSPAGGALPLIASLSSGESSVATTWSISPALGLLSTSTGSNITYTPPAFVSASTTVVVSAMLDGQTSTLSVVIVPSVTPLQCLLAGNVSEAGNADGTGAAASFNSPTYTVNDSAGNVYVADSANNTIRKIKPSGVVTTFAGTAGARGSTNGTGAEARFANPQSVAIDSAGNIYVADQGNNTIRKVTSTGVTTTFAGTAGMAGSADGKGAAASFRGPKGLTIDGEGNMYVADTNNSTIRKITPAGDVTTFAGTSGMAGSANGKGTAASFYYPVGVATDSADNVYVGEFGNTSIRKITPVGVVTTIAGSAPAPGSTDGAGAAAGFNAPQGLSTDSAGNMYVADTLNNIIRKVTPAGVTTTFAGKAGTSGSADGTGTAASFNSPKGLTTDSAGNAYVSDTLNNTIRKVTPAGEVTTFAGTAGTAGSTNGTGSAASFNRPNGLATDSAGNVYVSDTLNNTIRKITPAGDVTTFAGTAGAAGSANGTGAAASFNSPIGLAADSAGNVYVADTNNSTIRKITPAGEATTFAGTAGAVGSANGTGTAASFNRPTGIATDSAGNVYVADTNNSTIRKITPAGVVTTVVGVAGRVGFTIGALPGALNKPQFLTVFGNTLYATMANGVVQVVNLAAIP